MSQYNKDTYCSFAFSGYDNRNKWVCCIGTGNLNSYNEVNASEEIQNLRKDLVNGVKNPLCNQCWQLESVGLKSTRQNSLELVSHEEIVKEIETPRVKFLWLNSGNNCNFACRTCDALWSSSLYKEEIDRRGSSWAKIVKSDVSVLLDTDFSAIKRIVILGGEPFLNLDYVSLLEKIASDGHANGCHIVCITNNSKQLPERIKKIADQFASITLCLSIDATEQQFEYIRTRGIWNTFVNNLNYIRSLQQEMKNIEVAFHVTASALNVLYLDSLWNWIKNNNKDIDLNAKVSTAFCLSPDYYSFNVFKDSEKEKIIIQLKQSEFDFSGIVKQLENSSFNLDARNKFFEELAWTTQYHKLDYKEYLPLLADILEK